MRFRTKMKLAAVVAAATVAGGLAGAGLPLRAAPPTPSSSISGSIAQVGGGSITLKRGDGSLASATIDDSTVVKVNTQAGKAADLRVGMNAIVFVVQGQPATEIRAYTR